MSTAVPTKSRPAGGRSRRRPVRRAHGPINRAWILTHRWVSLVLGLLLLVEVTSGVILLYHGEIDRVLEPQNYAATPSATAVPLLDAMRSVQATHPEIGASYAYFDEPNGVYRVYNEDGVTAFVDPGSGQVLGVSEGSAWFLRLMVNVHDCALTCSGYPGYQEWLTTPLPMLSESMTVGGMLLGVLGVVMIFLAVSGAIVWWPGLRAWVSGFVVRRGRGPYVRDLDLHRVVGLVAVPFLFMWGFTGAAFEYDWPKQVYFAVLPGEASPEPESPAAGTGPELTWEQAIDRAVTMHPGTHPVGLYATTPDEPGGTYGVSTQDTAGNEAYVLLDSHGGGVADYNPNLGKDVPLAQAIWEDDVLYDLHFGTIVGGWWRTIWLALGLTPILLAVTGVTVWLTKRRSKRARAAARRRRKADAEAAPQDETASA